MVRALGVALALCCLFAAGCGESGPKRYQVSGDVNFKKKPVKMGTISFRSDDGFTSAAQVVDGKYNIPAEGGLPEGKYKVAISYPDPKVPPITGTEPPGEARPNPELLPKKYNAESTLTADVKSSGDNKINFDLE